MQVWELLVREQVRDTIVRYATAGDRGRFADMVEQFVDDATLEVPPAAALEGREAILAHLSGGGTRTGPPVAFEGQKPFLRHFTTNVDFRSMTAERVETTTYFCVMTALGPDHWGRYFDVLVPVGDRWLFRQRHARTEGWDPLGWYAAKKRW